MIRKAVLILLTVLSIASAGTWVGIRFHSAPTNAVLFHRINKVGYSTSIVLTDNVAWWISPGFEGAGFLVQHGPTLPLGWRGPGGGIHTVRMLGMCFLRSEIGSKATYIGTRYAWYVPLLHFTVAFAIYPAIALAFGRLLRRRRLRRAGRCESCGYTLRGLPEPRCPECRTPFDRELVTEAP